MGAEREDGYRFFAYRRDRKEHWVSPDAWHRHRIYQTWYSAKQRSCLKEIPFGIDVDYLLSIYPKDGMCPALAVPMVWGAASGRDCSPSLDRRVPKLGYVRGNVAFISDKANRIKTNATTAEICAVANYLKG
jgi:hypothetical protein